MALSREMKMHESFSYSPALLGPKKVSFSDSEVGGNICLQTRNRAQLISGH